MTTEEYDSYLKTRIKNSDTTPAKLPERETVGKSLLGLMCPNPPYSEDHDYILLLQGYVRGGCSVDCGYNWLQDHIELMLKRGPHQLALENKAGRQLRQETAYKITHKYACVVKWGISKTRYHQN